MEKLYSWSVFITEGYSRAPLYHSLKYEYVMTALKNDRLACHSSQRIWPGGKRLKDDEPGYEDSWYLRGLSLTRDKYYAQGWNSVVFEFDQEKLSDRYKLLPYNWGYHIGGGYRQDLRAKREREEFLIMKIVKEPKGADEFIDMQLEPAAYLKPRSHYLIGFTIEDFVFDKLLNKEQKEYFSSHPLFRGVFTRKRDR